MIMMITAGNAPMDAAAVQRMITVMAAGHVVPMVTRALNAMGAEVYSRAHKWYQQEPPSPRKEASMPRTKTSSIEVVHTFPCQNRNRKYDSLAWYAKRLPQAKSLRYINGGVFVTNAQPFRISDVEDVWILNNVVVSDKNGASQCTLEVFSYTIDLPKLTKFCDRVRKEYEVDQDSCLRGKRWFFDESSNERLHRDAYISFNKSAFHSFKTFDNMYGATVRTVHQRVAEFANSREWYERRGVPYTLGLLLYGPPGTGKTSLIKAIANYLNRHVVSVVLSPTMTRQQLKNLFLSDYLATCNSDVTVPVDKRVIVIEDADCADSVVVSRSSDIDQTIEKKDKNAVTLADLLNVLDGVVETPGRVMIFTTNHPERLDEALIRPGRIDYRVELGRFSIEDIADMLDGFFEQTIDRSLLAGVQDGRWTAAEVSNAILASGRDLQATLERLRG
jgi:tRNA A37 threonylcarbamoyladenosine biosynthesis protein TsaE